MHGMRHCCAPKSRRRGMGVTAAAPNGAAPQLRRKAAPGGAPGLGSRLRSRTDRRNGTRPGLLPVPGVPPGRGVYGAD